MKLTDFCRELKITPGASVVNHLLSADDSLLLFKASSEGADTINRVIGDHCAASGQLVNRSKSAIFFQQGLRTRDKEAYNGKGSDCS